MILNSYCIYDRKALRYHVPFFSSQDGEAIRSFSDLAQDPNTTVGRHPGDYVLYRVGAFDDANGSLLPATVLEHVIDASACVAVRPALGDLFNGSHDGNGRSITEFPPVKA